MERFRLRCRYENKRGQVLELHLFPEASRKILRETDGRVLGTASEPEAVSWLRQMAAPYLIRATPSCTADDFRPDSEARWLEYEDGMRLALAFTAARWLATPQLRRSFREGVYSLASEVILYWFTLCFYGYRQAAGRAALRVLLTHEEFEENPTVKPIEKKSKKSKKNIEPGPEMLQLFAEGGSR